MVKKKTGRKLKISVTDLKLNPKNPRLIKDDKFKKLCKSLRDFPEMMSLRPLIVDKENVIIGGNMRFRALKELGYKEILKEWVKSTNGLTPNQIKQFVIKDNIGFGEWDFDILSSDFEIQELLDMGFDERELDVKKDDKIDLSNSLTIEYKIEIECKDENEQENIFNELNEKGYKCRILTL